MEKVNDFTKGLKDGIPIALGYISVSITFGLAAVANGLDAWQAVVISLMCVTSAGQFAGIDVMLSSGGYLEMMLVQFIINIRYSVMSVAISQKADQTMTMPKRLIVGFGVTDEIFAVAVGKNKSVGTSYMLGLMSMPILGWTLGTLIGSVLGAILPDIVTSALGIGIYAMFLAIIIPPARGNKAITAVIIFAVLISCIRYYTPLCEFISSGTVVIIASLAAAGAGAFFFPIDDETAEGA